MTELAHWFVTLNHIAQGAIIFWLGATLSQVGNSNIHIDLSKPDETKK